MDTIYTKKKLVFGSLVIFIFLAVGALATIFYFQKKQLEKENRVNRELDISRASINDKVFGISGKVEKINGSIFTIRVFFFGAEKNYSIKVTGNTKIVRRELKPDPSNVDLGKPPASFKETELNLSDIKVNDSVAVNTSEDIKDKAEFTADTIILMN